MMVTRVEIIPAENTRARRRELGAASTCIGAIVPQSLCILRSVTRRCSTRAKYTSSVHYSLTSRQSRITNFVNNS